MSEYVIYSGLRAAIFFISRCTANAVATFITQMLMTALHVAPEFLRSHVQPRIEAIQINAHADHGIFHAQDRQLFVFQLFLNGIVRQPGNTITLSSSSFEQVAHGRDEIDRKLIAVDAG